MRLFAAIAVVGVVVIAGCGPSQADYDAAQAEIQRLRSEVADLRNTPTQRLAHARDLIRRGSAGDAERELNDLVNRFPGSSEAQIARSAADSLARLREAAERERRVQEAQAERERLAREAEADRLRRLGFRALTDHSVVKVGDVTVRVSVRRSHRWILDRTEDVGEYHYRDAERGADFILADLSITADSKNPSLPPVLAYSVSGDRLNLLGIMGYEFKRWRTYGGYLGNYADYTNDFAHTSTIPFIAGLELPDATFSEPLLILIGNTPCVVRNNNQYRSPKVSYENNGCSTQSSLTLDEARSGFTVVKVLNRSRL